jgi:L-ascorbate metabolism protein UlaG (beta-lactamase superfamily)
VKNYDAPKDIAMSINYKFVKRIISIHLMQLRFLGHSGFWLGIKGKAIVFDPYITPNEKASSISIDELSCDLLLQSHAHGDHIADSLEIAKKNNSTVVSCYETTEWFAKQGIEKVHPMNIGGNKDFGFVKVKMVNAVHSNSFPDGTYAGSAAGFVLSALGKNIYYAGDTALTYDMKLIAEEFKIDYAILPVGDNFTMGMKDAIKAAQFVSAKKVIGMHFDTFGFIEIDHKEAILAFANAGIELQLLNINQTINIKQ